MRNNTTVPKLKDRQASWHLIDAGGKVLGKVSTEIASLLIGKDKIEQVSNQNWGDKVVVINAENVAVTGKKLKDKLYHRYTGYPGGIRTETLENLKKRRPTEVIRRAVKRMLPDNKLTKERMANLYIYVGEKHPHEAQLSSKKEDAKGK
ncbi:MAG: 50S ribosomal protein L13 [Patescibacteria group bacterium]